MRGGASVPTMEITTGTLLDGRFELEALLAEGGMGDVYRALDHRSGEHVAVKLLRPGVVQGAARFAAEVESLGRLEHPNIVALIDAGAHAGTPFLVMELVPGKPLGTVLEQRRLELEEVRRVGAEIASALAYAHERGVINRDVNPGNILFDEHDVAKLADFGIALLIGAVRITATGVTVGSAAYLAPEQIGSDEPIGPPADVYALGLVLVEAATGEPAYPGPLKEAAIARLAHDPKLPPDLPEPWRRLLALMTSRDPGSRPSAEEVAQLLTQGLEGWRGE
jgi:eukaryotic-like serine/threonine-protein kinase